MDTTRKRSSLREIAEGRGTPEEREQIEQICAELNEALGPIRNAIPDWSKAFQRIPPGWEEPWRTVGLTSVGLANAFGELKAFALYDLRLSEDKFWDLDPYEFGELLKRRAFDVKLLGTSLTPVTTRTLEHKPNPVETAPSRESIHADLRSRGIKFKEFCTAAGVSYESYKKWRNPGGAFQDGCPTDVKIRAHYSKLVSAG